MQFSGLLPLLRLCDGSFRRAERDETELLLRTPQRQSYPRASRGCEVPARPSRNLALQCLDRHRSGSCAGVPPQVTACHPALLLTRVASCEFRSERTQNCGGCIMALKINDRVEILIGYGF